MFDRPIALFHKLFHICFRGIVVGKHVVWHFTRTADMREEKPQTAREVNAGGFESLARLFFRLFVDAHLQSRIHRNNDNARNDAVNTSFLALREVDSAIN